MLLLLDGYSCHIQLDVPQHLNDNNVCVIDIQVHTSHYMEYLISR